MKWYRAGDLPRRHEGKLGWWYNEKTAVQQMKQIPVGYSREARHCCGIWIMPVFVPAPPKHLADVI